MEKGKIKLSSIKPNPNNPRIISDKALSKLSKSIDRDPEFMVLRPIVIDDDRTIISGNQRYRAIETLGIKEIPDTWIVKSELLTPEQLKRFALVDNSPKGMSGYWDFDILATDWELSELEEIGFDPKELGIFDDVFTPTTNPSVDSHIVNDDEIDKAKDKLGKRFNSDNPDYIEVSCPSCGNNFFMKKEDI